MEAISQETRETFEAAASFGNGEWFDGFRFYGRRVTCFGLWTPMGQLARAGQVVVAGHSMNRAAKEVGLALSTVSKLVTRASLPYTYQRPRRKSYEANMRTCDKRSQRIAREVHLRDFLAWVAAEERESGGSVDAK